MHITIEELEDLRMEVVRRQSLLLFHTYSRLVVGDWRFVVMMTWRNYRPPTPAKFRGWPEYHAEPGSGIREPGSEVLRLR
jgi:hypothetical protein